MAEQGRTAWQERSRDWAARSVPGRAEDDTFNRMIIAEAGLRPGEDVLDTASGTGNPAVSIALAMEGRGSVTCCDFVPRMVEAARARARNLGLAVMRFLCADMLALPFPEATFDAVTCRFGIMSVGDRAAAAKEALRVLRPGGRAAYVVWGPYEENPPFWVPRRTAAAFFGEEEGPPPPRHSMGAPGAVAEVLEAAGFEGAEERALRYERRVEDVDGYVANGLRRGLGERAGELSGERLAALEAALRDAWKPFERDGALYVPNYARLGLGRRGD